jgi:hypothetical protein
MGELLAYGGSGNSGEGLQAPKLGLEFDLYSNTGDGSVCSTGQRNDYSGDSSRDHVAWVFWGHDYWVNGCNGTHDDNRHGAGFWSGTSPVPPSADIPTNPENIGDSGAGDDGYYYDESNGGNWMRGYNSGNHDKKFLVRVEIDRSLTANLNGNYPYSLKGWIVRDDVDMPEGFDNVNEDYFDPDDESTWPQVVHAVALSSSKHASMDEVLFGWTTATGSASQTITISNFQLTFKHDETSCPEPSKPSDYVMAVPMFEGQSGNMRNTVTNANSWSGDAYWLAGKGCPATGSRYFDNDHGPAPFWSNPASALTTEGTVAAWVYLKSYKDFSAVLLNGTVQEVFCLQFTKNDYRSNFSTVRFNEDRRNGSWRYIQHGDRKPALCITQADGKIYCVNSQTELELERWYHLATTWDAATDEMQFFVDGEKTATFTTSDSGWDLAGAPGSPPWSNDMLIGGQDTSDTYNFQGMIDDVYLYDRVLTDNEIAALYSDGFQCPQE